MWFRGFHPASPRGSQLVSGGQLQPEWGSGGEPTATGVISSIYWPQAKFHQWFSVGAVFTGLSGIPFNLTTGHDDNRDGLANDRPAGVTRNTGRGPGAAVIDLRWFRELRLKPSAKDKSPAITLSVDAFNLLNHVNYQNYLGALSSPFFGQATGSPPARRVQLGLRFQF